MPPNSPSHIGRYELIDRLGEGGMGVLYLARDPVLGRTVAIKVLSVNNDELRERFAREARSAAALKHNHIVTIYDVGEDKGQPFIAMEYLDGETMSELIRRRAVLSVVRKLTLMLELCSGLGYAHRYGIIHRDIKPANVMITTDGVLKILDFGLARLATEATNAALTRVGTLLGTPHYMSPEQIQGKVVDLRSDIFAVGLVLYELLTFRKAYSGDTPHIVLHNIINTEPQPIRQLYPDIDSDLEQAVQKAIEKVPERRYQNLVLMAADLSRIRERLQGTSGDSTVKLQRPVSGQSPRSAGRLDGAPTPTPSDRHIPNLDAITRRRSAQIERYLEDARKRFEAGEFDAAMEQCELAAVIDPNDNRVLDLLDQTHRAIEDRKVREWLLDAQAHLSRGELSQAEGLIEQSLQLRPQLEDAQQLQRDLRNRRREQERIQERARAVIAALERARANIAEGALEAAIRSASEVLAFEPGHEEARALRQQAVTALDEQWRRQAHEQRAFDVAADSRRLAAGGRLPDALELLRQFRPSHPLVDKAITDLEAEVEAQERRRREEAAAQRQKELEEEQRRKEAERLDREREEAARRLEEEEQRRREVARQELLQRVAAQKIAARDAMAGGRFGEAFAAAEEARALTPGDPEIDLLIVAVHKARAEAESSTRVRRVFDDHLAGAATALQDGEHKAALRLTQAALQLFPEDERALALNDRVRAALEDRQRQEERRRAAEAAAAKSRRLFIAGDYAEAIRLLEEFSPIELVAPVIEELRLERRRLEERQEAEAARRLQETEAQTLLKSEEARRKEEVERQRQELEVRTRELEEARRREAEALQRKEEEARQRQALEARVRQEEERRQREQAESLRRQEEERRQREQAETLRRQKDEEAARQRKEAEARARQQEEERHRREQAEAARRASEAAVALKRQEAEARRREDEQRRQLEEEARRLREENALLERQERAQPLPGPKQTGSRRWMAGAAAAVLLVGALAAWQWSRLRPGVTPGPPPVDVGQIVRQAEQDYRGQKVNAAIDGALTALKISPGDAASTQLLRLIRAEAASTAAEARKKAQSAGSEGQPPFADGVRMMGQADAVKDPGETQKAVAMYLDAAQLFGRAESTAFRQPDQFLAKAKEEYIHGRTAPALQGALEALKLEPRHAGTLEFLGTVRSDAARRAENARDAATRAGVKEATSQAFKDGKTNEQRAAKLRAALDTPGAVGLYNQAQVNYETAQKEVRKPDATSVTTQPQPAGSDPAAAVKKQLDAANLRAVQRLTANDLDGAKAALDEAQKLSSSDPMTLQLLQQLQDRQRREQDNRERDDKIRRLVTQAAQTVQASPQDAVTLLQAAWELDTTRTDVKGLLDDARTRAAARTAPPPPQQGDRRPDETAIRTVWKEYEAAFESRNVAAVKKVYPAIPENNLRKSFKDATSISMTVRDATPVIAANGTTATISCGVTQITVLKNGTETMELQAQVEFSKSNGSWIISKISWSK